MVLFLLIGKVINSSITQLMSFQNQSDMKKKHSNEKDVVILTGLRRKSSTRALNKSRLRTGAERGTLIVVSFLYR